MRHLTAASLLLVVAVAAPASAQNRTVDGAALGGVAGAIAGGIIGHQNDETPEGALIGGAVGAISGGLIGHGLDKQAARERAYQEQIARQRRQLQYQQQQQAQQAQQSVSINDVVTMSRSGVSDNVIINHVQTNGVQRRLETHDIISLTQQGVSEPVINAMQRAPVYAVTVVPAQGQPQTVVVQQHYHSPRPARPTNQYYRAYQKPYAYKPYSR
ncbi:MAG: glycine zipper domain-containing protein [Pirellulales bacterium]